MILDPSSIPTAFWTVPYDGARIPAAGPLPDLTLGANCQLFAYALLAHFGRPVPPFRSSDLWSDTAHTAPVTGPFEPLDLLLFNPTPDPWAAHVAVSLGGEQAIHLSKRAGVPALWSLARFAAESDYRVLIGGKRPL
jgi:hypothetical protein